MERQEEVINTLTRSFQSYFDHCKTMPPDIRFTVFVDKLLFVIGFMKAFAKDNQSEMDYMVTERVLQMFEEEVFALQDHLRANNTSEMETIRRKLDDVLMGPDYGPGRKMMEKAKEHFEDLLEDQQI